MPIDIRPIHADELPAFVEALTTGFLERPDVGPLVEALHELWDLERVLGAFDGGRIVGTFRSWPTELTLPGGARIPMTGVAGVTVQPTHRRRGILRAMIATEHAAARARGDVVGGLYASEYPIYGRFGYGPACREATWELDATRAVLHGEPVGTIELVTPDPAWRDTIRAVYDTWRSGRPGEIARRVTGWDFDLGLRPEVWGDPWKGFLAIHRAVDGAVDGYARYHAEARWEHRQPRNTVVVDDLHALTDGAETDLWRFLAAIDWVATLRADRRSPSDRLPWRLVNARAARITEQGDGLWLRLLDVPTALASRRYAGEGSLVLEVVDSEAPDGRLRVRLDAGQDGAHCRPTADLPDLTLPVAVLGAGLLGGTRLADAGLATGIDEHRAGALDTAERLFATLVEPWCSTFF